MKLHSTTLPCFRVAIIFALGATTRPIIEPINPPYLGVFDKQLHSHGVRILGSRSIPDEDFFSVDATLAQLLEHQPIVEQNLAAIGSEIRIIGEDQDFKNVPGAMANAAEMHRRGVARFAFANVNCVILPEENIRPRKLRPYPDARDIASHEIAHMLHLGGFSDNLSHAISARYDAVKQGAELWPHAYAMTNDREFFAELTMWYFHSHGDPGRISPHPSTGPQWLKTYDPESYALIDNIYSGRLAANPIHWTPAKSADPKSLHSGNDGTRATLLIKNTTTETLSILWLDFDGHPHPYGTLAPGETAGQDTYISHAWKFTNADDKMFGACLVESSKTIYAIPPR